MMTTKINQNLISEIGPVSDRARRLTVILSRQAKNLRAAYGWRRFASGLSVT
jgi:hypothetical protein